MDNKEESPVRGLKRILTKPKKNSRDDTSSSLDLNSPSRGSSESVASRLIPGHSKRQEKRRRKSQIKGNGSVEGLASNGVHTPKSANSLGISPSASTLNDEGSSLLTSDSDEEM